MARLLTDKKSTNGSPYAFYTVDCTASSRKPTSVKLKFTVTARLQYYNSWIGTGTGYGLTAGVYVDGEWHNFTLKSESTSWSGTTEHTASITITVDTTAGATSISGMQFRVNTTGSGFSGAKLSATKLSNISIASVTAKYANVSLKSSATTQAQSKITLSGMPKSVGFATTVEWYRGSKLLAETDISANSTTTTYSKTYISLLPDSDYTAKTVIKSGSTTLKTVTCNISTPGETGALTLTAASTYITAKVTGMFNDPNYTRTVEFYYKKSTTGSYTKFSSVKGQGTSVTDEISGLISNVEYDVQALVKDGSKTLKTLEKSITTAKDTSLIPTARISSITQKLGTRECTITWLVDKSVAGTVYTVQMKTGSGAWNTLATLEATTSPVVVTANAGNVDAVFRITSVNDSVASGVTNYSNEYEFYVRDDFEWDTPKTAGQPLVISANEWNRLRAYAIARNTENGTTVTITTVKTGDPISAAIYNEMKQAISNVSEVDVQDKSPGDPIKASEIDALRVAINS